MLFQVDSYPAIIEEADAVSRIVYFGSGSGSPHRVSTLGWQLHDNRLTAFTINFGPSGFGVGSPNMLWLTTLPRTRERICGSSRGHLATVLAGVKGSLALLGDYAALDTCCAPWCLAATG